MHLMLTRAIGIVLGLFLAFAVTKAVNPESPVVTTVETVMEQGSR
jgi:hypothetical protein